MLLEGIWRVFPSVWGLDAVALPPWAFSLDCGVPARPCTGLAQDSVVSHLEPSFQLRADGMGAGDSDRAISATWCTAIFRGSRETFSNERRAP
jgi:hypothetical protein